MKKIGKEFSEFIQQGNLIEIAVGLLIATAFKDLVTSFSNSFIMPIINKLLGYTGGKNATFVILDMKFTYGDFIAALISFLIIAIVLFVIVKSYNKLKAMTIKQETEMVIETELSLLKDIKSLLEKNKQ